MNADEFLSQASMIEAGLEQTLEIPLTRCGVPKAIHNPWNGTACGDYTEDKEVRGYCWGCMQPKAAHTATAIAGPMGSPPCPVHPVVSREELVEFIRCIAEGEPLFSSKLVQGQRAIELAAWDLYRRLQEGGEL